MVHGGRHGADTIVASGETTSYCGLQTTIAIASIINALEKDEGAGIWCSLRCQIVTKSLNGDVDVTNDVLIIWVQLLRCRVVSYVRVGEFSCVQVRDLKLNIEVLVGGKIVTGSWIGDDG